MALWKEFSVFKEHIPTDEGTNLRGKGQSRRHVLSVLFFPKFIIWHLRGNEMIITNNIKVRDFFKNEDILFVEGDVRDVFRIVRDYVHKGHSILTHPLSGSVKPIETPFKSIMLTTVPEKLNLESLNLIEQAIINCDKFEKNSIVGIKSKKNWGKSREQKLTGPEASIFDDFREIDFTLFFNAIAGI
ncbi:MAG: GrdX family protein [Eubacteriales bacterium]|nr:GrdX family protein [Eubacteriales bacterium]